MFVWVLGGVGECLGVYEKFCYKNFGSVEGEGRGVLGDIRTTPDRRGRGGLKITILAGRPL